MNYTAPERHRVNLPFSSCIVRLEEGHPFLRIPDVKEILEKEEEYDFPRSTVFIARKRSEGTCYLELWWIKDGGLEGISMGMMYRIVSDIRQMRVTGELSDSLLGKSFRDKRSSERLGI